jgi:fluoride exporter
MSRSTPTPAQARIRALHPGVGLGQGVAVVALGGALGAVARWGLESAFPAATGHFPWTTLLINVVGSGMLAALPLLPAARRRAWVGLLVGTGMLGGFTTMSTASVDTFVLLDAHHVVLALAYCLGTVGAALTAVLLVDRLSTFGDRAEAENAGWDE